MAAGKTIIKQGSDLILVDTVETVITVDEITSKILALQQRKADVEEQIARKNMEKSEIDAEIVIWEELKGEALLL